MLKKCDRPIKDLGEGKEAIRAERRWRGEPKRLNLRCSNQIQGFWPKRTQVIYLPRNLSVTAEIGPFFTKFKCRNHPLSRIRSLESFDAPSNPSIKAPSEAALAIENEVRVAE